jgi:hypothetical protein
MTKWDVPGGTPKTVSLLSRREPSKMTPSVFNSVIAVSGRAGPKEPVTGLPPPPQETAIEAISARHARTAGRRYLICKHPWSRD